MEIKKILESLPEIKDQILVFDNLFSKNFIEYLQKTVNNLPFTLGETTEGTSGYEKNFFEENKINNINDNFQLCNIMYINNPIQDLELPLIDNIKNSAELLTPLYFALSNINCYLPNIDPYIQKIKINLQSSNKTSNNETYNFPHVDNRFYNNKGLTILYYVNDSDGDTFFFNEKDFHNLEELRNLTIRERVSPKAGRLVVFRSDILHAGSHPISSPYRIVINYNIFPYPLRDNQNTGENLLKDLGS